MLSTTSFRAIEWIELLEAVTHLSNIFNNSRRDIVLWILLRLIAACTLARLVTNSWQGVYFRIQITFSMECTLDLRFCETSTYFRECNRTPSYQPTQFSTSIPFLRIQVVISRVHDRSIQGIHFDSTSLYVVEQTDLHPTYPIICGFKQGISMPSQWPHVKI